MGRVLIVDAEPQLKRILAASLDPDQHTLTCASGAEEARVALRANTLDAVLVADKTAGGNLLDLFVVVREADPNVAMVVLTTTETLEHALESLQRGAFDLLVTSFPAELARLTVRRACGQTALLRQNHALKVDVDRLKGSSHALAHGAGNGNHDQLDIGWIETLPPTFDLRGLLATLEKSMIERMLQSTRGAQAEAARRLGLSRSDLSYKLLKYELRKETTAAS